MKHNGGHFQHSLNNDNLPNNNIATRSFSFPEKINLDDYLICQTSKVPPDKIQEYLDFCRMVFPCKSSTFGTIFKSDIDVTKALELLKKCNYNLNLAKFKIAFPVLTRFSEAVDLKFDQNTDYEALINDFLFQNSMNCAIKEKNYFDSLNKLVLVEKKQAFYKTIKEYVEEGLKNKYAISSELQKEITKCKKGKKDIEKFLSEKKVLEKIEKEIDFHRKTAIVPENFDQLLNAKEICLEQIRLINDFLSPVNFKEKDLRQMAHLIREIQAKGIGPECAHDFKIFFENYEKTVAIHEQVIQIAKPLIIKDKTLKIELTDAYKMLEFMTNSFLKDDQKIQTLIETICRKELCVEKCMMFCEDDRNTDSRAFFAFNDDLKKGALNFENVCNRVDLKIRTLEHLSFIHKNIHNEAKLNDNLRHIYELEKLGTPFYREETEKLMNYLVLVKRIDLKIEELNNVECSFNNFLFADNNLMNVQEIQSLLEELDRFPYYKHQFNFVNTIQKYLESFFDLEKKLEDFTNMSTIDLISRLEECFEFKLKTEFLENSVREELAGRIEIEFFVYKMIEKYSSKEEEIIFNFAQFKEILEQKVKLNTTFEENVEEVKEEIEKLKNQDFIQILELMINQRQLFHREIESFSKETDLLKISTEFEQKVKNLFKDKDLLTKAKIQISFLETEESLKKLEYVLTERHPDIVELENKLLEVELKDDIIEESFEKIAFLFFQKFDESKMKPILFSESKLESIFSLISKRKNYSDSYYEQMCSRIKKCREVIAEIQSDFLNFFCSVEKSGPNYVFKVLHIVILACKLNYMGISPDFSETIHTYLEDYRKIEDKLSLSNKKTIKELIVLTNKFEELHIFSQNYNRLLPLLKLIVELYDKLQDLEKEFTNDETNTIEAIEQINKNINLDDYEVEWFEDCLELRKRPFELLENNDFLNFINVKGKRIKKYQNFSKKEPKLMLSANDEAEMKNVILVEQDKQALPICMCRETFEITEMVQFNVCSEWFHLECIKMQNNAVEKNKEDFCFGCDFLNNRKNAKINELQKRKLKFEWFLEAMKTCFLIESFIVDPVLDFLVFIHKKIKLLKTLIAQLRGNLYTSVETSKNGLNEALHSIALLYLYIPVENITISEFILQAFRKINDK